MGHQEFIKSRIQQVNEKLDLLIPSKSLLNDLQLSIHKGTQCSMKLTQILKLPKNKSLRAKNCEELTELLIKMAIDKSLLGRMWIGWAAFI